MVRVSVGPLPTWFPRARLLGDGEESFSESEPGWGTSVLVQPTRDAAQLAARLRGLGVAGRALSVTVTPALSRNLVRSARLDDARARRKTTPGFLRAGARAEGEGRFSLTPESLALAVAQLANGRSVVDACCGSGGNALAFARSGSAVSAIELSHARLAEARHNAQLYGVLPRIRFLEGDARTLVPTLSAEILYADPPWGENYDKKRTTRAELPLIDALLPLLGERYRELWLKLPASFAVDELPRAELSAWFGEAEGDQRRVKFLLARISQ